MNKKGLYITISILLVLVITLGIITFIITKGDNKESNTTNNTSSNTETNVTSDNEDGYIDVTNLFSNRDKEQTPDTSDATKYTVEDSKDIKITEAGTYVISGTAKNVTVYVEVGDEDKVQLVLDNLNITNTKFPCVYVKTGDKVFITTVSSSSLTVTDTFKEDQDNKTNAVILSKSDLTLNGTGTLTVKSSYNGIVSKDELTITGGTYNIEASNNCFRAHDSIAILDGVFNLTAGSDGLHAEYDDDDSVGFIYIAGGTYNLTVKDDAIHATTILQIDGGTFNITCKEGLEATIIQINGGDIKISASDDGINAAKKSSKYSPLVEINGGTTTINMGQGDTDGVDSNGDIVINGGTISITGNGTFDYDGKATYNGGTIIVNGQQTTTIPNQFAGGGGQPGGQPGGMNQNTNRRR